MATTDDLTGRVERLERSHRRLAGILAASWVAAAMLLVAGRWPAGPVAAREFAAMRFALVDAAGRRVGALEATQDGTRLAIFDARRSLRIALTVLPEGVPGLAIYGPTGRGGVVAIVKEDGSPALELLHPDGRVAFGAP